MAKVSKVNEALVNKSNVKTNPEDARIGAEKRIVKAQGALRLVRATARSNWSLSDAQRESMAQAIEASAIETAAALRRIGTSAPTFSLK